MTAFTSLNELDGGAALEADVAIIGAGAAGITLARALAGSRLRVLLLEGGGREIDPASQDLYDGESVGLAYDSLMSSRLRYLGGTTNHWTGWVKPLDAVDFRPRPWMGPLASWPIGPADIEPHMAAAAAICEAGSPDLRRERWEAETGPLDPFDPARFGVTAWGKSPPTLFGARYEADLAAAPNVRVLLDANVTRIALDPSGARVAGLDVRSLGGKAATVRARRYVLACGGIENARLLLASDDVAPGGIGNGRDWVGRCFMEHAHWYVGQVLAHDPSRFVDLYFRREVEGDVRWFGWRTPDAAQEELGVGNHHFRLYVKTAKDGPIDEARRFWRDLRQGGDWGALGGRALGLVGSAGDAARAAWREKVEGTYINRPIASIDLDVTNDPRPYPDSRVTLGEARDALGTRRPRLDWRLHPDDGRDMTTVSRLLAAEIGRLGLGSVRTHPALADDAGAWAYAGNLVGTGDDAASPPMYLSWHHQGTTRMSATPETGVVDPDCRVHGVDNLHVAGSSVFPTSGSANPTLTIVALALRLADHLQRELVASPGRRPAALPLRALA